MPLPTADYISPFDEGFVWAVPLGQSWAEFHDWFSGAYAEAPVLVIGLTALLVAAPLLAFGFWFSRREGAATTVSEAQTQVRRIKRERGDVRDGVRTGHIPLRPREAWLEIVSENAEAPRFKLGRSLVRIGRESDNEICLQDITVHRYHAAIQRTEDAEFVITDLSSARGNGVVVNDRAVKEARLASGDIIELGKARLKFSSLPIGHSETQRAEHMLRADD